MLIVKLAEGGQFEPGKTVAVPPEPVDVFNKVTPRFGSEPMAYAWCMSEPLFGFDGRTAMQPGAGRQSAAGAGIYRRGGCGRLRLMPPADGRYAGSLYRALNHVHARGHAGRSNGSDAELRPRTHRERL